jgi:hypothetical protein
MTYNVYQHWDPLRVCAVGRSYPPEFYNFIENPRLRELFQRIARETEEDYQGIIKKLEEFGVEVVRPNVPNVQIDEYLTSNKRLPGPVSMTPRDQMIMIGDTFFVFPFNNIAVKTSGKIHAIENKWTPEVYNDLKGDLWPQEFTEFKLLPPRVKKEIKIKLGVSNPTGIDVGDITEKEIDELIKQSAKFPWWQPIIDKVKQQGNTVVENQYNEILNLIPSNGITRIGRDLYFGNSPQNPAEIEQLKILVEKFFGEYRCHFVTTDGHIDGCFTPIKPGLIVSILDIKNYEDTFPGWEVVYLEGESYSKMTPFLELKKKNQGKWWVKDHEYDDELINYVETWLGDWVGYAEESVFDVNILVIDEKNIITSGYNEKAFEAFARHGVTAHICPLRHRYFWDGGVHCATLDLHRESTMRDYFPERGLT